jgi:hypothetical protein
VKSSGPFYTKKALLDYGYQSQNLLLKYFTDEEVQSAIKVQFSLFEVDVLKIKGKIQANSLSRMDVDLMTRKLYFTLSGAAKGSVINNIHTDNCQQVTGDEITQKPFENCVTALADAATGFDNYQVNASRYQTLVNDPKLTYLNSQWERYIETARSQTLLDVWITSVIHDGYYSQRRLVEPASTQFFLLRPQVVYEFSKDAKKGDRNQIGLAAEWFGVNWWDLKVPIGVSAVSIYSDYEGEDSIGHGALLTFSNSASIGYVRRGNSDGIFVTLDFLKLWQDKSEKLAQYKADPWAWFK